MRRRFTQQQWVDWIEEQSRSGLTVTEFCRRKKVGQNSFYLWRKKLAGLAREPYQFNSSKTRARASRSQPASKSSSPSSFVSLSIAGTPSVEIDLPCGATIRLPHDEVVMRHLLSALLELGRSE